MEEQEGGRELTKMRLNALILIPLGLLFPKKLKAIFVSQLARISDEDWTKLVKLGAEDCIFHRQIWRHRWFDGSVSDISLFDNEEPAEKEKNLFRLSSGRFALENRPVSFWAGDPEIARNEVTNELRRDTNLTFDKMLVYVSSKKLKSTDRYLVSGTTVLDLRNADSKFLTIIEKYEIFQAAKFHSKVLLSRSRCVYPVTHAISEAAVKHGFGAVVWRSVRAPRDINPSPDTCMVVFDKNYLTTKKPSSEDD